MNSIIIICALLFVCYECAQNGFNLHRFRRFPVNSSSPRMTLRERFTNRIMHYKQMSTTRVCYDTVGCFDVPHSRSPLQKSPEAPEMLNTKFFLFRRNLNFSEPEVLYYDDQGKSLNTSKFDERQPLRIYIHGYMSQWNEKGAFVFADTFLKMDDSNFIVMDWAKGARGPQYTTAAANTEVAGRQLGILLMNMINKGLNPKDVHLIGFSLGAHVAGCAAELIKSNGKLLGRITGLDAAGPLFRHNHLKERSKKLDISDADFVDVLHTDSSPVFVDGFGLWEPIGHIDFFANGGQEQPGCTDRHNSVVVTTFERNLDRDSACSHIRAVHLFLESLRNKISGNGCEFTAFKCPGGLPSFTKGQCFPQIGDINSDPLSINPKYYNLGVLGEPKGDGVMYFVTRGKSSFCGTQLQSLVYISPETEPTQGMLRLKLKHGNYSTSFSLNCDVSDYAIGTQIYGLAAAEYKTIDPQMETLDAYLSYFPLEKPNDNDTQFSRNIYLNKITVRDMEGHSWMYCGENTLVGENTLGKLKNSISVKLNKNACQ